MNKKNAILLLLGFALGVIVFHRSAGDSPALRAAHEAAMVTPDELQPFFQAVAKGDFPAMASLGGKAFVPGHAVADAATTLAGYETNSFPPYTVYAFFTANTPDKTRRVLLTLDSENRVESFLAEEMAVIR